MKMQKEEEEKIHERMERIHVFQLKYEIRLAFLQQIYLLFFRMNVAKIKEMLRWKENSNLDYWLVEDTLY